MTLVRMPHVDLHDPTEAALHALDTLPAMVAFWDTQERCVYANSAHVEWFGRPMSQMPGLALRELLGAYYEQGLPQLRRVLAGERVTFDRRITRPDGVQFDATVTYTPAFVDGEVMGFTAYVYDVTTLRRNEAELASVADMLQRTSELAQVGGGVWNADSEPYWSPEVFRMYDVDGTVMPDIETRYGFIAEEARAGFRAAFDQLRAGGAAFEMTVPVVTAKGRKKWMRVRTSAEREQGRLVRIITAHQDVTEQVQADQARAQLEVMLQHSQRMESVGRLAGGVAHDFNNMLAVILGNSELALEDLPPSHPLVPVLREIEEAARRSSDLTRQLLTFARQSTLSPRHLHIDESIAGTLRMLRRMIGESITITFEPGAGPRTVLLDPTQLDQILANLCVNARDAIDGSGTITMTTTPVTLGEDDCAIDVDLVPGEYVRIRVSDTGSGMQPDVQAHIFEPFFTTKKEGRGSGLGLATVYGAVHQNHGCIRVRSAVGRGTTFEIEFPLERSTPVDAAPAPVASGPQHGQETVLLVEDEVAVLRITERILRERGYRVLTAHDGHEAVAVATAHADEIDLLVTDVIMPDIRGHELAREIAAIAPGARCLYISGYPADDIGHHGMLAEGVNFLAKPFTAAGLATRVREVLDAP